jgi:hypothetical protein
LSIQRILGEALAAGLCGLVWYGCTPTLPGEADAPATRLQVLSWPDTLVAGDSALARVEVLDSAGSPIPAEYAWEIDRVEVAGLHGTGKANERRVLAFRPGQARLRVRATWNYCWDRYHCRRVPVTDGDSTRNVVVEPGS